MLLAVKSNTITKPQTLFELTKNILFIETKNKQELVYIWCLSGMIICYSMLQGGKRKRIYMVSYYFSKWELKADECSEEKLLGKVIGSRNVYNVSMTVPKNSWYHILDKNTCCIVFLDYIMLKLVFIFIICMYMYLYYRQVRKLVGLLSSTHQKNKSACSVNMVSLRAEVWDLFTVYSACHQQHSGNNKLTGPNTFIILKIPCIQSRLMSCHKR